MPVALLRSPMTKSLPSPYFDRGLPYAVTMYVMCDFGIALQAASNSGEIGMSTSSLPWVR